MVNKIKTSIELSLLAFVIVISTIGVSVYGILEIKNLNEDSRELYQDRMIPVGQLGEIRHYLSDMVLISNKVIQNQIGVNDARNTMSRELDSVHVLWKEYSHTYFTKKEKINYSKTILLLDKFSKIVQKLELCLKKNDLITFNKIVQSEFYPTVTPLIAQVNDLIFLQLKEGKNILENIFVAYDSSKQKFIGLMIIIFAVSTPLFLFLFKKNLAIINSLNYKRKKLIETEKNYRAFIDYAGDAILILNTNTKIVDLNEFACNLFGYTREELLKMDMQNLFLSDIPHHKYHERLVEQNKSGLIYAKAKCKDGNFIDTEITNCLMEGGNSFAIIRDITERKRIEDDIKESEEKYRYLFNNNPAHIVIWDIETLKVLEVNDAILKEHGYNKAEWLNMNILDYRQEKDHEKIKGFVEMIKDSKETVFNTDGIYLKKNGGEMFMEVSSHIIEYNNRKAVLSLARDMTEQLKAKNELKKSEEKYHSLVENAGDAIYMVDANLNVIEVNSYACQLLGYSREELLKMKSADFYSPEDFKFHFKDFNLIQEENVILKEAKVLKKDGNFVDVEISRRKFRDGSFLAVARNITERKKAEAENIENKELLKLFIEHSPASLAMFDTDMNYIATSNKFLENNGITSSLIGKCHYDVFPFIGQEWKDVHQRCLAGATEKKDEEMFIWDGKIEWIKWEVHPWKRANGKIGGIILFDEIITERKQATELFKYQFENSPDAISIIDKEFKIVNVNRESSSGLTINQMIGFDCIAILPKQSQSVAREHLKRCFEKSENQEFEIELSNGRWGGFRLVPIVSIGEVTHVMVFNTDISTRKHAEQKLLQSEERYRVLTENISDAIVLVNKDFELEYISPTTERISGYPPGEGKSKLIFDFIHPDDVKIERELFAKAYNSPGIPFQKQNRIINSNGKAVWVEGTIVNLLDNNHVESYVINFRDITNRKKLEEQQALIALIVNSSDDAIISKSIDGIITSWNVGAERILGYTATETIGNKISMLVPLEYHNEEKVILETIKKGTSVEHFETKRLKKNGDLIDVSLTISPVKDPQGNIVGASKIMRDITDRKKIDEELIRYNCELKKANSELDRFVYSASHDLRAPLKSILGLVNITKEYVKPEDVELADCMMMLNNSVLKLDSFIEDILSYSRNSRTELDVDIINFKELMEKIKEDYQHIEGVNDFDVQLKINAESAFVSDSKRVSIVLNNIISNAFKYKDNTKEISSLKIDYSCNNQNAIIKLEDNGIGIEDKHKEKVFEMFYRATMLSSGSGLGLYIVKETIDKLGGQIAVESEFGVGTKFTIEIPNQINVLN